MFPEVFKSVLFLSSVSESKRSKPSSYWLLAYLAYPSTLKVETVHSSKTLVNFCQTTKLSGSQLASSDGLRFLQFHFIYPTTGSFYEAVLMLDTHDRTSKIYELLSVGTTEMSLSHPFLGNGNTDLHQP
jgi:hypothetical protein